MIVHKDEEKEDPKLSTTDLLNKFVKDASWVDAKRRLDEKVCNKLRLQEECTQVDKCEPMSEDERRNRNDGVMCRRKCHDLSTQECNSNDKCQLVGTICKRNVCHNLNTAECNSSKPECFLRNGICKLNVCNELNEDLCKSFNKCQWNDVDGTCKRKIEEDKIKAEEEKEKAQIAEKIEEKRKITALQVLESIKKELEDMNTELDKIKNANEDTIKAHAEVN
jgi:hypothetical protein